MDKVSGIDWYNWEIEFRTSFKYSSFINDLLYLSETQGFSLRSIVIFINYEITSTCRFLFLKNKFDMVQTSRYESANRILRVPLQSESLRRINFVYSYPDDYLQ